MLKDTSLQNEVALVTGASRGIGQAIANALSQAGARVIGTATSEAGAANISAALGEKGRGAVLDVGNAASIDALLARMTLEEKLGQLAQWSGGVTLTGPEAAAGSEKEIRAGRVGSFLGLFGAETTRRLQKVAVEESRLHIPLLISFDVIHGLRTVFPVPLAEAASWKIYVHVNTCRNM